MELSRVDLRTRPQWLPISLVDAIEADVVDGEVERATGVGPATST